MSSYGKKIKLVQFVLETCKAMNGMSMILLLAFYPLHCKLFAAILP